MLPFLKNKNRQAGGVTSQYRTPTGIESKPASNDLDGIEAAAKEICQAIESKDYSKLASALKAAFQIFDSEPHVEGIHEDGSAEWSARKNSPN